MPEVPDYIGVKHRPRREFYKAVLEVCSGYDADEELQLFEPELTIVGALAWIKENSEFGFPHRLVIEKAKHEVEDYSDDSEGDSAE